MKVICAWCQRDGIAAVLGEREPLDDATETHGICDRHRREVLIDLYARSHSGAELLLIVAPTDTKLYRYLTRSFAGLKGVEVILDRRRGNRRRQAQPTTIERRSGDRRVHRAKLHGLGYQTVRLGRL